MRAFKIFVFAPVVASLASAQYAITTIAGGGPPNGTAATAMALSYALGVAIDGSGNVFFSSESQNRVYKIVGGNVTAVAGVGIAGFSGDNGPATSAQLNNPGGIALDNAGNLYIADRGNYRIRKVSGGVITTIAGTGAAGYFGDNGPATAAQFNNPESIAVDSAGQNVYIADTLNYRIRKVSGGTITTIAGTGSPGYSGDTGPATSAQISQVLSIAYDSAGQNLYLSDTYNGRVRKVSGGVITTVAGNGINGYTGDNGPATSAEISFAVGVGLDGSGNFYIADASNDIIREVSNGIITTIAGNGHCCGFSGDNGPATSAQLYYPYAIAGDNSGNLYFTDVYNYRIRKVSGGTISTFAGNGSFEYSGDNGPATSAQINPNGLALDGLLNVYVADLMDYRVRKVSAGSITTAAGNGTCCYSGDNGPPASAQIGSTIGLAGDGSGNLYIADTYNNRVRKISNGLITTIVGAGYGYSGDGGPVASALITSPTAVATDNTGNTVYITDQVNSRVRKISGGIISLVAGAGPPDGSAATGISISPASVATDSNGNVYIASQFRVFKVAINGMVVTVAGNGTNGFSGDNGPATSAQLGYMGGIAVDSAGQNLYISDNGRIRKVSGGVITTVAGGGGGCVQQTDPVGDGCPATSAVLNGGAGVAVDSSQNIFIADTYSQRIRKVSGGVITSVAGNGTPGYSGDNGAATSAQLQFPSAVAVDNSGNLFIADNNNQVVRKVSGGIITTVAGNGFKGYSGDNGPATNAQLSYPSGVAVDSTGQNLYIADSSNDRIRKVSAGVITTVAGSGACCSSLGDGGLATNAQIAFPSGVAVDGAGQNLYLVDSGDHRIRKVSGGVISTIAGNGSSSLSGDGGQAVNAQLSNPTGLAVDASGNLYISDAGNSRVRVVSSGGTITTVAGGGTQNPGDGGPATSAVLSSPTAIAVDDLHNVYIQDQGTRRLRKISGGVISTVTSAAAPSRFATTGGLAVDKAGDIYVSEPVNGRVRVLMPVSIASFNPTSVAAGSCPFTLTISGANLVSGDIVLWNGAQLQTTFVSAGAQLQATVPCNLIASAGAATIAVLATDGGTTNALTYSITPPLTCSYMLSSASANVGSGASTGGVGIATNCAFSVVSNNPDWIVITGTITYSIAANSGPARMGSFTVLDAGKNAVATFTINQDASPCTSLTVSPATVTFSAATGSGTGSFNTSPCAWSAVSSDTSWLTLPVSSGSSAGFAFNVAPNATSLARSATVTVNNNSNLRINVTQNGVACTYAIATLNTDSTISPNTTQGFLNSGGSGRIAITAPQGCAWTAAASGGFVGISAGNAGNGNGTVSYTVAANPTSSPARMGSVTIQGLNYLINEAAGVAQNYAASVSASLPPAVRAEGISELTSDILVNTSGLAAPGGVTGDVLVTFNTAVTSRALSVDSSGQTTEALLLLNEPAPQSLALNINAFRGIVAGPNAIRFASVPLAPASVNGGSFSNTLRLTNLRVDASQLTMSPSQVIATVSIVAPVAFPVSNPQQVVAFVQKGSAFSTLVSTAGPNAGQTIIPVQFAESAANAFRPRLAPGQDPSQPGVLYNSESGYVNTAVLGTETGFATNGARLVARITGVPGGVTVYAPLSPASGGAAQLVSADSNGVGGFPVLSATTFGGAAYQALLVDNTGATTATWEVTAGNPNQTEMLTFNLLFTTSNVAGIQVAGAVGPQAPVSAPSITAPIARFVRSAAAAPVSLSVGPASQSAQKQAMAALAAALARPAAVAGGNVTFTEMLLNAGSTPAANVVIGGSLPAGSIITSVTLDGVDCSQDSCTRQGPNLGVKLPSLFPGQTRLLTITARVRDLAPVAYSSSIFSDAPNLGAFARGAYTANFMPTPAPPVAPTQDFAGSGLSGAILYDPSIGQSYTALPSANGSYSYIPNLFTPAFDTLLTGDFNGDGRSDLIVYNSHTALAYIGMSNGDGTFAFQSLFWSPNYDIVQLGDINGDGKTDVALYNSSTGTLYTGIGNGTGGFTYLYHLVSRGFTFVRLADFTGDGMADLLLYNSANGATYLGVGDGTGAFAFHPLFVSPGYALADVGDLNGDGKADVIFYNPANGNAATGISDGAGGLAFTPLLFSPGFTSVRLADHTGDGLADVTVYNQNTAAAYFGTGNGAGNFTFQSLFWSPGYNWVVPEDVNGDRKVDVILYNSVTGAEYTGISNGNGSFAYTYQYWGVGKILAR